MTKTCCINGAAGWDTPRTQLHAASGWETHHLDGGRAAGFVAIAQAGTGRAAAQAGIAICTPAPHGAAALTRTGGIGACGDLHHVLECNFLRVGMVTSVRRPNAQLAKLVAACATHAPRAEQETRV